MLALSVLSCTRGVRHTGNEARHVSSKRRAYSFERIIDDDLDSAVSSRFAAKLASKKKKAASSNNIPPHSRTSPSLKDAAIEGVKKTGKLAEFKSLEVDPKVRSRLSSLQLGKLRLQRQTKEDYGRQRDLSGAGEKEGSATTMYFRPGGARLLREASRNDQFPEEGIPEVCFAGRSNVGKSSLLNAVAGGKPLSRTSSKPGETTTLRWYSSSNLINFVDLPGYGFSFADSGRSSVWMELVKEYFSNRKSLKRCFVLIDARQPIKQSDESTMRFLEEAGATFQIILTKADLVTVDDLAKRIQLVTSTLKDRFPKAIQEVIPVSAKNRAGLAVLRRQLISLFQPDQKLRFEAERDKKWAKAEKRRDRRATEAEKVKEFKLHKERVKSRRALVRYVKNDRKHASL